MNIVTRKIKELKPADYNPRKLTEAQEADIRASLDKFGLVDPIVVNTHPDRKDVIVGGHQRVKVCKKIGLKEVPTVEVSLNHDDEKELNVRLNKNSGEWDFVKLDSLFQKTDLIKWGFKNNELNFDFLGEDDFLLPDEVETDIQIGDLFQIGNHRLLCGDSTEPEDVERLMNGQKADMVFTDPPYGVNVKGGKNKNNLIAGDLTQTAIPFSFEISIKATKNEARYYFCGGENNIGLYYKLFDRYLGQLPRMLVWVKNGFVMKPNGYHNGYELIFYGYKTGGGGKKHWYGGRKEEEANDVWNIDRDASIHYVHPTQKPVKLSARAVKNHSDHNHIIFDPFLGSGSTMVASHQLKRRCYGLEIEPNYCQAIIDRMRNLDKGLDINKI